MLPEEDDNNDAIRPERIPLFLKGREIFDITTQIVALIPEDNDMLQSLKGFMLEDAALLSVKVAGAEGAGLYDIRMECAALIRKAGRDMLAHCSSLEMFGFRETHYLHLIREAIEEYRLLFIDWVRGFDPWDYVIDRWGLFNPPGVGPHDHNPDDDLPFTED
ncbi:hypothetical protein [Cesiribacter andamanensis]|uniref:Uncharacterized protein n=1 Tax=Cesiribacter andamanensis AMV16 TaxID=1279009 RepID=M7NV32_9BACT|nr:hypothetical protein [Cesiribacter andamanensis]EMR02309.1 hypothetical protein ADICEAN_02546 [Cesiribacter andamanensis AMV16]